MKKMTALFATAALAASTVFAPLSASAQEKTKVTFWHAMNGPHQEELAKMVEKFNSSQDKYEVVEQSQGDYAALSQKVLGSAVSGELPTMSQLTASNIPDYASEGLLAPLDDLLTEENGFTPELTEDIYEGFLAGVKFEDQQVAMPFSKSVRLMFVNKDLLEEAGFTEVPKTWEEVKALGEALDKAGSEKPAMGLENGFSMEVETMAKQAGAQWIADDLSATDIAGDKSVEVMQFLQDLIKEEHARTAGEDGYMSEPFAQGESALYIGSSAGLPFVLPGVEESGMNFETAEIPVYGEGDPLTLFAGNDLGVFESVSDEEKAGAVAFMAFLLEADNTAEWASKTGYLPITKSGAESQIWKDYVKENPYIEAATKELEYGKSQVPYAGFGEVFTEFNTKIEEMILNDADVKESMQAIEDLVKGHLGL